MIKVFNVIMAEGTVVSFHTNQFALNILTDFARILVLSAPTIHFVMEIRASSMIMIAFIRTLKGFKIPKVHMLNSLGLY